MPLSNVVVADDKCSNMSGKLGDTNANNLLDISEVWIYTCTTNLKQTTTNTVTVTAYANDLKAVADATITVVVQHAPGLPNVGMTSDVAAANTTFKNIVWGMLAGLLAVLILIFTLIKKDKV